MIMLSGCSTNSSICPSPPGQLLVHPIQLDTIEKKTEADLIQFTIDNIKQYNSVKRNYNALIKWYEVN